MAVEYEQPVIIEETGPTGGMVESHPAYAMIGASRVTGNRHLFGSLLR